MNINLMYLFYTKKVTYGKSNNIRIFKFMIIKSMSLLSFLTKINEDFLLNLSRVCSSLHSNHRIVCCFTMTLNLGTRSWLQWNVFIEHKLIHNCSCVAFIECCSS